MTILESADSQVYVDGQVLYEDQLEYLVDSSGGQIRIKVLVNRDSARVPSQVIVRVPQQMDVTVETNTASVTAESYLGDLAVSSVAGNINIEEVNGVMMLGSNRGDITVKESSGQVGIVGNYGRLKTQNVKGELSVSTIMGNIVFNGLVQDGDKVRLETDHGAVTVNLNEDSSLAIKVSSTSGDVACMLPGITSTARACTGNLGVGAGSLWIRTVSGAVLIQKMP
ncbi:MAG: DUF4097 family beta strand repeat-containing protein [Bacteroidota bacterium]